MNMLNNLINIVYWFCVDFVVNLGNLLGISYVETNGLLFLILFPLCTLVLLMIVIFQGIRILIRGKSWSNNA